MGLISRVSSRTYRSSTKKYPIMLRSITKATYKTSVSRRPITTSSIKSTDLVQSLYVSKIQEYAKLSAAGKLDFSSVHEEIEAVKERAGAVGDMESFPVLTFKDADHGAASHFDLETSADVISSEGSDETPIELSTTPALDIIVGVAKGNIKNV